MESTFNSWGILTYRIGLHARGESSLGYIAILGPVLVAFPSIALLFLALLTDGIEFPSDAMFRHLTVSTALLLSILSSLWWCFGTYRASMLRLSRNAFIVPALLFAGSLFVGWHVAVDLTPFVLDFAVNGKPQNKFSRLTKESHLKPWTVIAMPELKRIIAVGEVNYGSAAALRRVVSEHPEIGLLEVDSPGGYVSEMNSLVDVVTKNRLDTVVINRCYSACTDVFLAGERRYVGHQAKFGFHQSGFDGRNRDIEWSTPEYMSSIFYRARGIEKSFFERALNTSYYDLWRPDPLDVKRSGFATAWWSDRGDEYR